MVAGLNDAKDWQERGFYLKTPPLVIAAYDPAGSGDDNDALVLIAREEHQKGETYDPDFAVATKYRVLASRYLPQGIEFPEKFAMLLALYRNLANWVNVGKAYSFVFTVEANGVGWAMASALQDKIGQQVISYMTVGAETEKPFTGGQVSMPRLAALNHVRVLLETQHLKMVPGAPGAKQMAQEIGSFVWAAPKRPEAITGQRDDMIMALAGGCWMGSKIIGPILKADVYSSKSTGRRN